MAISRVVKPNSCLPLSHFWMREFFYRLGIFSLALSCVFRCRLCRLKWFPGPSFWVSSYSLAIKNWTLWLPASHFWLLSPWRSLCRASGNAFLSKRLDWRKRPLRGLKNAWTLQRSALFAYQFLASKSSLFPCVVIIIMHAADIYQHNKVRDVSGLQDIDMKKQRKRLEKPFYIAVCSKQAVHLKEPQHFQK